MLRVGCEQLPCTSIKLFQTTVSLPVFRRASLRWMASEGSRPQLCFLWQRRRQCINSFAVLPRP